MLEETIKTYFSQLGKKSSNKLTPEQRKERAQRAAKARWSNPKDNVTIQLPSVE